MFLNIEFLIFILELGEVLYPIKLPAYLYIYEVL